MCDNCGHAVFRHGLSCMRCPCKYAQWRGITVDWKSKPYHDLTLWEKENRKGLRHAIGNATTTAV